MPDKDSNPTQPLNSNETCPSIGKQRPATVCDAKQIEALMSTLSFEIFGQIEIKRLM